MQGRQHFVTSCLLFCTKGPSEKESVLKGKNLLPMEASLLLQLIPFQLLFQTGGKNNFDSAPHPNPTSLKRNPFPLNCHSELGKREDGGPIPAYAFYLGTSS